MVSSLLQGDYDLVFGSQILDVDAEYLDRLRSAILNNASLDWIIDVVRNLTTQWHTLSDSVPVLRSYEGLNTLENLSHWMRTGDTSYLTFPLPNIVLTPFVVVTHLVQYAGFLQLHGSGSDRLDVLQGLVQHSCGTIGFCTGQLSAAAVSSSADWKQLSQYGACVVRASMAIGAVVDACDSDRWRSFVVRRNPAAAQVVSDALAHFSEAYVSVVLDKEKVTVSVPQSDAGALTEELKERNVSVGDISLQGAFHTPNNADHLDPLLEILGKDPAFMLPRVNGESPCCTIARSMLTEKSDWPEQLAPFFHRTDSHVIAFGTASATPPSLAPRFGARLWQIAGVEVSLDHAPAPFPRLVKATKHSLHSSIDDPIAVVGMAVKTPGADDLDEFWELLCNGPPQHVQVSPDRHDHQNEWHTGELDKKVFASFISDADCFDHRFFKKSPREAASTDPQHRLMLMTAYRALEQSGYFCEPVANRNTDVGCYVGIGLAEYERNAASHPATAYAVTGNLMSFAAGKVSHHFGWRGPSIAVNAACSSSGVAIDLACKAILSGECSAALAGGVNAITRPEWFNFLGAGSFLNTSGQCKPFDDKADGYSRGEGVGAVYLKRLSKARADGDNILGIIAATRTLQNQHSSTITAPTSSSLADLFSSVVLEAGLQPKQISFVEAHGTGTQVGDTIEYEGIRRVLGGPSRDGPLFLSGVKGLIGHTESASGIVALVKALLALQNNAIPPHHSFQSINPALKASSLDQIEISTKLVPWAAPFKAAMVNNYGASGANFAQIITEPPARSSVAVSASDEALVKYPFWLCGNDEESIKRYASCLLQVLRTSRDQCDLRSLSFNLSRQSNRSLSHALTISCATFEEFESILDSLVQDSPDRRAVTTVKQSRPVILCFGGQYSRTVSVDQAIYDHSSTFRCYLDACDDVFQELGLTSMYPDIFEGVTPEGVVALQSRLFAVQYSSARTWIDSGIEVKAVVGHSFGELVALCVSGTFSMPDMARMIIERARIIEDEWQSNTGAMLSCDSDNVTVDNLVQDVRQRGELVNIACYNGPRSFTLSGSAAGIKIAEDLAGRESAYSGMRVKPLNVTHAFHSGLVDPLHAQLSVIGADVVIREPSIHVERATADPSSPIPSAGFFAEHLRNPVCFHQAAKRLSDRYPESVWLEAGSGSGVTSLVRSFVPAQSCHFQPVNLSCNQSTKCLSDVTVSLWEQGQNVRFWAHHSADTDQNTFIQLPPYQFEKSSHWLKPVIAPPVETKEVETVAPLPETLWTFISYQDAVKRSARFRVNTNCPQYQGLVRAHVVANTAAVCPSTLQMTIAMDALQSLIPLPERKDFKPRLQRMENQMALCIDNVQDIWLDAHRTSADDWAWEWKIHSNAAAPQLYVSGIMKFAKAGDAGYQTTWDTYDRLANRSRCTALLDSGEADGVLKGKRNIYKAFAEYVDYRHDEYKGLSQIAGRDDESAGRVQLTGKIETFVDMLTLIEPACQVAGVYLSSMTERSVDDMYISHGIGQWIVAPGQDFTLPTEWEVHARHRRSDKGCVSDVFAFDANTGSLIMVILGIGYNRIALKVLRKVLSSISKGEGGSQKTRPSETGSVEVPKDIKAVKEEVQAQPDSIESKVSSSSPTANITPTQDIEGQLRTILANLLGLESAQIKLNSDLIDLGVDSLLAMELARDVEQECQVDLRMEDLIELTDFNSLLQHVQKRLGISTGSKRDSGLDFGDGAIANDLADADARASSSDEESDRQSTPSSGEGDNDIRPAIVDTGHDMAGHSAPHTSSYFAQPDALAKIDLNIDKSVVANGLEHYLSTVEPLLQELCVSYVLEALGQLGSSISAAKPEEHLHRLTCLPPRMAFLDMLYQFLEADGLLRTTSSDLVRTSKALSTESSEGLYRALLGRHPEHTLDCEIVKLVGSQLAPFLAGEIEGVQLTFGNKVGKKALEDWYEKAAVNTTYITKMESLLRDLVSQNAATGCSIRILEIGGGTAGTTKRLMRMLKDSKAAFQYTFSDVSSSLVAAARRSFREYKSMDFLVLDVEQPPAEQLQKFDIVITTNCIHATRNLRTSVGGIRSLLLPGGLLLMLEMTMNLGWINFVFGVFEGWWLFEDGRKHALASESWWKDVFEATGFELKSQTRGDLPEGAVQTVFLAQATEGKVHADIASAASSDLPSTDRTSELRQIAMNHVKGFTPPAGWPTNRTGNGESSVLITGGTGSLGAHLVEYFANHTGISTVVCLNRPGKVSAENRQESALTNRLIQLPATSSSKIRVLATDTSSPLLGLTRDEYDSLTRSVALVVHNAFPMNVKQGLNGFTPQFQTMRNLIEFARDCVDQQHRQIGFQFVSSLAAQTYEAAGSRSVTSSSEPSDASPGWGYGSAKLICETMLQETLARHPNSFNAMSARVGQVSGSRKSGFWTRSEHLPVIIKTSQTLQALPDFDGELSWLPVDDVAAIMGELLLAEPSGQTIFHVENPSRLKWKEMSQSLANVLNIPSDSVLPLDDWIARVRASSSGANLIDLPAAGLLDHLSARFIPADCARSTNDTKEAQSLSPTLRHMTPVGTDLLMRYVLYWRSIGYLK